MRMAILVSITDFVQQYPRQFRSTYTKLTTADLRHDFFKFLLIQSNRVLDNTPTGNPAERRLQYDMTKQRLGNPNSVDFSIPTSRSHETATPAKPPPSNLALANTYLAKCRS